MKYLLIFCYIFISLSLSAQTLTREKAIACAEKLYEARLLSERGKQQLISELTEKQKIFIKDILQFCEAAFWGETYYRTGLTEWFRRMYDIPELMVQEKLQPGELERREKEYAQFMETFEGWWMEEAIAPEDSTSRFRYTSDEPGYRVYGLIHPQRSVLGKHRTRTINDLFNVGLIDDRLRREMLGRLDELPFEFSIFEYLSNHLTK